MKFLDLDGLQLFLTKLLTTIATAFDVMDADLQTVKVDYVKKVTKTDTDITVNQIVNGTDNTVTASIAKVSQNANSENKNLYLLLSGTNSINNEINTVNKSSKITANPSTGLLSATTLNGNLTTDYLQNGTNTFVLNCGNQIT